MHEQIRLWHYSARTGPACVGWGRRFISANGTRRPGALGAKEVEASLTSLATTSNVAAATRNQALSALLLPYRVVPGGLRRMGEVVRGRRLRRLPVVLSQEEVARLPQALPERERELMARLRYRTGMCLLERQRLRIKCVDFVGREISGHSDKGGRDRCVPLPESLRGRLLRQRGRSLVLQGQDPAGGNGRVHLPHASARK